MPPKGAGSGPGPGKPTDSGGHPSGNRGRGGKSGVSEHSGATKSAADGPSAEHSARVVWSPSGRLEHSKSTTGGQSTKGNPVPSGTQKPENQKDKVEAKQSSYSEKVASEGPKKRICLDLPESGIIPAIIENNTNETELVEQLKRESVEFLKFESERRRKNGQEYLKIIQNPKTNHPKRIKFARKQINKNYPELIAAVKSYDERMELLTHVKSEPGEPAIPGANFVQPKRKANTKRSAEGPTLASPTAKAARNLDPDEADDEAILDEANGDIIDEEELVELMDQHDIKDKDKQLILIYLYGGREARLQIEKMEFTKVNAHILSRVIGEVAVEGFDVDFTPQIAFSNFIGGHGFWACEDQETALWIKTVVNSIFLEFGDTKKLYKAWSQTECRQSLRLLKLYVRDVHAGNDPEIFAKKVKFMNKINGVFVLKRRFEDKNPEKKGNFCYKFLIDHEVYKQLHNVGFVINIGFEKIQGVVHKNKWDRETQDKYNNYNKISTVINTDNEEEKEKESDNDNASSQGQSNMDHSGNDREHPTIEGGVGFWRPTDTVTDIVESMSESETEGEVVKPISDKNPPSAPIKQKGTIFVKPGYVLAKCVCKNSGGTVDFKDCPRCNPTL